MSTFGHVVFMLFIVVYGSPLPKLIFVYGNPLSSFCGLRKSELNHLRKSTFGSWFTFQALILTDLYSNQLNDAYTYRCMTNMTSTTQKMKNEKLRRDIITCVNVEEWRKEEGDHRKKQ